MRACSNGVTSMRNSFDRRYLAPAAAAGKAHLQRAKKLLAALVEQPCDGGAQLRDAAAALRRGRDQIGKRRRPLAYGGSQRSRALFQFRGADLVAFGEDDFVADGGLAQRIEDRLVDGLQPMARIDQEVNARQRSASMQKIRDQTRPGGDLALGRGGVTVTRHVD